MTQTESTLLQILSIKLFPESHQGQTLPDVTPEVLELAKVHAVPLFVQWKGIDAHNNITVKLAAQQLHKILTQAGIPYVILKGSASAWYYGKRELMRTAGDIDFLVARGDVEKCTNVLVNTGSQRSTEPDCDYHRQFKKDGIEYELHWMVKGSQYSSQTIKTFMKDIIDTSVFRSGMNMPDDFHHGLVLLLHMISHITEGGLGLRQLCDWAVYVNQVDLSAWKNRYEECGLWTFACAVTAACDRYLGSGPISASHDGQISVGSPTVPTIHEWCADVPVSVCNDFIGEILQAGNFGRRNRIAYADLFLGDMSRPDQLSKRSRIRNVHFAGAGGRKMQYEVKQQ